MKNKEYSVMVRNDYFFLIYSVPQLNSNPDKIKITIIDSGEQIAGKWIYCKYHKLYDRMNDFREKAEINSLQKYFVKSSSGTEPLGITTFMGLILPSASKLSSTKLALSTVGQAASLSPPP